MLDDGHDEVAVTGFAARALVALVEHRRGWTLEQLIDLLWPAGPPRTARSAVHVHLGTLRKTLDSVSPGLAVRSEAGVYRLDIDGWVVDTDRATDAAEFAADALDRADADAALAAASSALESWRGPALTVAGEPVLAASTERLRLVRLALEEIHVDALLASGDHVAAEGRAIDLVEAESLREHRWAQLMRARAAQGRTADALATYQEARAVLVSTLGLEPGEELVALERNVLTGRPVLVETPPAAEAPDGDEGLDPIPVPLTEIIGRDDEVRQVEDLLARGVAVQLVGAPGAGKTRIAVSVAERAGAPSAWIDLRNASHRRIAEIGDDLERWARRRPAGLLVLDNAERAVDDISALMARFRRSAPDLRVLVTSRVPLDAPVSVPVEPLALPVGDDSEQIDASPAVQLLRTLLATLSPAEAPEPADLAALCRRMGGLPLGIRVAAELTRRVPLDDIRLASSPRLRSELSDAVDAALERLEPADEKTFSAMCVVAGQVDADLVGALAGRDIGDDVIGRLVDHGLATYDAPQTHAPYSVPEPLREIGEGRLDDERRSEVNERLVEECLARAERTTRRDLDGQFLRAVMARELPWYRQALAHLVAVGDDARALRLAGELELSLQSVGWWDALRELLDDALAIPGRPSADRARALAVRGRPGQLHQLDVDRNLAALAMAEDLGDEPELARACIHLGMASWWRGDHDEAIAFHERGREHASRAGSPFLIGEATRWLGLALVTAGRPREGFALQVDLLRMVERSSSPGVRAVVPHLRMYLGHSRRHVGELEAALLDLETTRSEFRALGNETSILHVAAGLADVLVDLGRPAEALDVVGDALSIATATRRPNWDSWLLCSAMRARLAQGEETLARAAARGAVRAAERGWDGDQQRIGLELAHLAVERDAHETAARILGAVDALDWPLTAPVRTLAELDRHQQATEAAADALGERFTSAHEDGAASTLAEAAARLLTSD